jgi:hypothetical protein
LPVCEAEKRTGEYHPMPDLRIWKRGRMRLISINLTPVGDAETYARKK